MTITPELDITPESAGSLERFRQLFHSGRFAGLALLGGIGTTDLQTLYRTMDRVVSMAAGYQLCTPSDPMSPAERLEEAQAELDELKRLAREWYASLDAAEQQAVIDLLHAIVAWLQAMAASLSPEAQAVLSALKALLGLILVEQTSQIPDAMTGTTAH